MLMVHLDKFDWVARIQYYKTCMLFAQKKKNQNLGWALLEGGVLFFLFIY